MQSLQHFFRLTPSQSVQSPNKQKRAGKASQKRWTLWELNPRPFTYAKIDAKRLIELLVRRLETQTAGWWKLTNHTPGEDCQWDELGGDWCAVDAYLDQAPDDVKAEVLAICCMAFVN